MKRFRFTALSLLALAAPVIGSCSLFGLDKFAIPGCQTNADCEPINSRDNIPLTACVRWQCDHALAANVCRMTPRDEDEDGDPANDPTCSTHGSDCDDHDHDVFVAGAPGDGGMAMPHPEWCDGKDNNCNGIVDEDGLGRVSSSRIAQPLMGYRVENVSISQVVSGGVVAAYEADMTTPTDFQGYSVAITGPTATNNTPLHIASATSGMDDTNAILGCPTSGGTIGCVLREAAIDGFNPQFVAAVVSSGCEAGSLYVGYRGRDDSTGNVIIRDFGNLSNVAHGVDTDHGDMCGRCTGHTATVEGATRPSVGVLRTGNGITPQGIVTYLAAPSAHTVPPVPPMPGMTTVYDDCTSPAAEVRALGVFLMDVAGQADRHWVVGSGDGTPVHLGTSGGGATAITTFPQQAGSDDRGYFIGYGDETGNVALHFVPTLAPPTVVNPPPPPDVVMVDASDDAAVDVAMDVRPDVTTVDASPDVMASDAAGDVLTCSTVVDPTNGYMLNPTTFPTTVLGHIPAHGARRVSLAIHALNPSLVNVGVTWVEGCGTSSAAVWFSIARWNGNTMAFTPSPPIQVSPAGISADQPTVVSFDHGFVRDQFVRNGVTATADTGLGGFYVAYVDTTQLPSHLRIRRVAEFDGQLIPEAPIDATDASVQSLIAGARLFPTHTDDAHPVGYLYGSSGGTTPGIIAGSLVCQPPPH